MKILLLCIQIFLGFTTALLFVGEDLLFTLCLFVFSLVPVFGLIDLKHSSLRTDAHIMVGGILAFAAGTLKILNLVASTNFSLRVSVVSLFALVLYGLLVAIVAKRSFK